jgi:hypothetical protein
MRLSVLQELPKRNEVLLKPQVLLLPTRRHQFSLPSHLLLLLLLLEGAHKDV